MKPFLMSTMPLPQRSLWLGVVVWIVPVCLATAAIWAHWSKVEEVTLAQGRIVTGSREQLVQTLEGGILSALLVREGDIVQRGQELAKIDDTRASAAVREGDSKLISMQASAARLRAEAYGAPLEFPEQVKADNELLRNETQAYHARRKALHDGVGELRRAIALAEQEIKIIAPLVARGLAPEVDLLRARRQVSEFRLQIIERENRYRSDANAELNRVASELGQTSEAMVARRDYLTRTTIRSPMRATVKNIRITTIGGVLQPGTDLLELVPLDGPLLVEARVKPADVAFLRPGMPATVKFTAYDFTIYGGLNGVVEHISPDTIKDDLRQARAGAEDAAYYRVLIRTTSHTLAQQGRQLQVIPGMTVTAEILTGSRTIGDYLMKPVAKAREAFRER